MKSAIREFNYSKKDGSVSTRKVFVLNETADYIQGFDTKYLTGEQLAEIQTRFQDREILDRFATAGNGATHDDETFNKDWLKAFRNFKKSNIVA